MLTPLDKAKALLDARRKATQGEWIRSKYGYQLLTEDSFAVIAKLEQCARREHDTKVQEYEWQQQEDNAKFIALAANHTEAICNRLVELEAENAELRARLEEHRTSTNTLPNNKTYEDRTL